MLHCTISLDSHVKRAQGRPPMATAVPDSALTADNVPTHHGPKEKLPALMLGAIGVVFGDIGTSPLYAMKESFLGPHPLAVDAPHIFGVLSLIFWSLMLVVTVIHGGAGGARRFERCGSSRNSCRAQPALGGPFLRDQPEARFPCAWVGVPRRHRRRDALCRHGAFRPQGDRPVLADGRLPLSDAQLPGPGCTPARHARGSCQSLLPDGARLGTAAAGRSHDAGLHRRQ